MGLRLERTVQCSTCPWRVGSDAYQIPGYCPNKHRSLESTIANKDEVVIEGKLKVMSCHHSTEQVNYPCIGWINNQLGHGNNILLRLWARNIENLGDIELVGEQHETFEQTIEAVDINTTRSNQ